MLNKIITSLIILNFVFFASRVFLSMNLSTRGDDLTRTSKQITILKSEIDQLESQIIQFSSLEKASIYAKSEGFVLSKMVKFSPDNLAHVSQN